MKCLHVHDTIVQPWSLHRCEAASVGYAHAPGGRRRWVDGVGDMDHGWRRRRHRTCVHTDAPDGARPRGERKDALDTVVRLRCRAQVASVAAAAAAAATAASLGVKPQAEAPHSAPVAPRGTLRRRLRRRTTCKARARTLTQVSAPSVGCCTGASRPDLGVRAQLHRSARASRRAAKGPRAGRWQVDKWIVGSSFVLRRAWSRPQRGGGARSKETPGKKGGGTHKSRGSSRYPKRLLRSPFSGSPG